MYLKILLILPLFFSLLVAETFEKINPAPTKKMIEIQKQAKACSQPITANEKVSKNFKYGCFCGKNYPKTYNTTSQDFRKLSQKQRKEIIESYFSLEPYDDIDAVCKQHDLCYLYQGKKAKICNNAIYDELHLLVDKFKTAENTPKNKQCKNLSSDIASVFKTIFAPADDEDNLFEIGMLFFNTSITIANKTLEESIDTIIDQGERYPKKDQKCLTKK
jgi:hypothetical protein